jgi:hypothetical protein
MDHNHPGKTWVARNFDDKSIFDFFNMGLFRKLDSLGDSYPLRKLPRWERLNLKRVLFISL